mmetsp:Transcript_60762/g.131778  ORF Transcript_60762/g.131778 Transcript_60762/m.131778 type:complete len:80 (+) Transcript_60762:340-579(+)
MVLACFLPMRTAPVEEALGENLVKFIDDCGDQGDTPGATSSPRSNAIAEHPRLCPAKLLDRPALELDEGKCDAKSGVKF